MKIYVPPHYAKIQATKKPYTIIYYESVGFAHNYLARLEYVETANILEYIRDRDVAFVFDGHCKESL